MEKTECPWALGRDLLLTSARHPGLQKRTPRAPQDRGSDMWVWQPGPFGCRTASEVTCGVFPLGETEGFTTTTHLTREGCQGWHSETAASPIKFEFQIHGNTLLE